MTPSQLNAIAADARARSPRSASRGSRHRVARAPARVRVPRSGRDDAARARQRRASRGRDPRGTRRARSSRWTSADARARSPSVPWVRSVALRRQWPQRLEVDDRGARAARALERAALVNTRGEVFVADYDGDLPQFEGPDGRAPEVADALPRHGPRRSRRWRSRVQAGAAVAARRLADARRGRRRAADDRAGPRRARTRVSRGSSPPMAARSARWRAPARASTRRPALSQRIRGARAGIPRADRAKQDRHDDEAKREDGAMVKDSKNLIVGLDIGTSKIVAIVAEIDARGRAQRHRPRHAAVARPARRASSSTSRRRWPRSSACWRRPS